MSKHDRVPVHSVGPRARKVRERKAAVDLIVRMGVTPATSTYPDLMRKFAEQIYDLAYANGMRDSQ